MAARDSMQETIGGHVEVVRRAVGAAEGADAWDWWPDYDVDGCADSDARAAWAYVTGYANALDLTALELISELGV